MSVREAVLDDVDRLVPLFDGYRRFYRQESDVDHAAPVLETFESSYGVVPLSPLLAANPLGPAASAIQYCRVSTRPDGTPGGQA